MTEPNADRSSDAVDIVIKPIEAKNFDHARRFAVNGMHLDWYATGPVELYLYSKYFWYLEVTKATRALGAYSGDRLVGLLLADMRDAPKLFTSFFHRAFVWLAERFIAAFYSGASDVYHEANTGMLHEFFKHRQPDGELNFFAVDPEIKGKGLGTLLLAELARLEAGKLIYLFTDSGSTHQFYHRRGFEESGRRDITLGIRGQDVDLTCFLFSKRL